MADSPLLLWIVASVLLYVAAASFLWRIRSAEGPRSLYRRTLFEAGRFVYFIGVPYLVLGGWCPESLGFRPQRGLLALEDVGLVGLSPQWPVTRWLEAASTGLGMGLVVLLVLAWAWASARRLSPVARTTTTLAFAPQGWWAVLVSGLYLEVHWAFYRGGWARVLDDVYVGVFVGLAAVCVEWVLNPFWRSGWRTPSRAGQGWLHAGLALLSALLFLLTRNLWVCLAVHWLLALAFWALARDPAGAAVGPAPLSPLRPRGRSSTKKENGARGDGSAP